MGPRIRYLLIFIGLATSVIVVACVPDVSPTVKFLPGPVAHIDSALTPPPKRIQEGRPEIAYPSAYGVTGIEQKELQIPSASASRNDVRDMAELMARLQIDGDGTYPKGEKELIEKLIELMIAVQETGENVEGAIASYDPKVGDSDSEELVLRTLNKLIAGEVGNDPGHTLLARLAKTKVDGSPSSKIPLLEIGKQQRRSAEHRYFLCMLGHGTIQDSVHAKQRFNRVLIEDIFRRSFVKSVNLSFHLAFLDDSLSGSCKLGGTLAKADMLQGAHRYCEQPPTLRFREPLLPGDVVSMAITNGLATSHGRRNFPNDETSFGQGSFVVRYLPKNLPTSRLREEARFVDLSIVAMSGEHEPVGSGVGGNDTKYRLHVWENEHSGVHFSSLFPSGFAFFWNGLIDPSIGILSQESFTSGTSTTLEERSPVSSRFLRVMLERGPQPKAGLSGCRSPKFKEWWYRCPDDSAPYDNRVEDLFVPTLRICPRRDVHHNLLSADNTLDYVSANIGARTGLVIHTDVQRARVNWDDNRRMRHPWSLREWEVSRILGAHRPKISSLTFFRTKNAGDGFPKGKFRISIAWPGDERTITVALRKQEKSGTTGLVWLDDRHPNVERVMSYRDLKFLSRPHNATRGSDSDDRVGTYLSDVPVSINLSRLAQRITLVKPGDKDELLRDGKLWDDKKGFLWSDTKGFDDDLGGGEVFLRYHALRAEVLEAVAAYALSVDSWTRYRLPAPDVNTTIKSIEFDDWGHYEVTETLSEANHRIVLAARRGRSTVDNLPLNTSENASVVLQSGYYVTPSNNTCGNQTLDEGDFCPSAFDERKKKIFWRDLEHLNAFNVGKVTGLTPKPLRGFIEDRQP